jgi:hypothetical protein
MRRILSVLAVALVMAAMVVVMAVPAFAAPPSDNLHNCIGGLAVAFGGDNISNIARFDAGNMGEVASNQACD